MALTNSQHDAIMRIYDAIRTENRHIQNERYAQVTAACPEIAQIEDDIIRITRPPTGKSFQNLQTVKPPVLLLLADLQTI